MKLHLDVFRASVKIKREGKAFIKRRWILLLCFFAVFSLGFMDFSISWLTGNLRTYGAKHVIRMFAWNLIYDSQHARLPEGTSYGLHFQSANFFKLGWFRAEWIKPHFWIRREANGDVFNRRATLPLWIVEASVLGCIVLCEMWRRQKRATKCSRGDSPN